MLDKEMLNKEKERGGGGKEEKIKLSLILLVRVSSYYLFSCCQVCRASGRNNCFSGGTPKLPLAANISTPHPFPT